MRYCCCFVAVVIVVFLGLLSFARLLLLTSVLHLWLPRECLGIFVLPLPFDGVAIAFSFLCPMVGLSCLELLEGNAENSSAAGEVTQSLLSRGIDVLWLSTDVTTATAQNVMIKAAKQAGIPVISSLPSNADHGALIALGSSYREVGVEQGQMVADILEGRDPATIPIINWTPIVLRLNLTDIDSYRQSWNIPTDVRERAQAIFDGDEVTNQDVPEPEVPEQLRWKR